MRTVRIRILTSLLLIILLGLSCVGISGAQQSSVTVVRNNYVEIGKWCNPPVIRCAVPSNGVSGLTVCFLLYGCGFKKGDRVELVKGGSVIQAKCVWFLSSSCMKCLFDLRGASPGWWDIRVTHPCGTSGVLKNGFWVWGCP